MFVGEAPGAEEDRQGLPFVGRAGQLLNQMLEEIGLSREDVFIANVLKSRPPGNRDPQPLEIEACEPYLFEQVRLIEPTVVCTLGNFATKLLSGSPAGITKVRGTPAGARARRPHRLPAAALPPGRGAAHARGQGDAARRLRDDPGPARAAAAGAGPERRGDRRGRGGGRLDPAAAQPTSSASSAERQIRMEVVETRSAAETEALGARIAERLAPGDVVVVSRRARRRQDDPVRGACRALGVEEPVTSPTFTIGQRYARRPAAVSHLDLYRLQASRARIRRCSTTTSAPTASPSSSGRRPARGGSAGRRWRCGSRTAAASGARSKSTGSDSRSQRARLGVFEARSSL